MARGSEQGLGRAAGVWQQERSSKTPPITGPLARGRREGEQPPLERAAGEAVPPGTVTARQ